MRTVCALTFGLLDVCLTSGASPRLLQRWYDPNHRTVPVPVLHAGPVQLPATTPPGTHTGSLIWF